MFVIVRVMFHHSVNNKQRSSRSFMDITPKSIDPDNCVNLSRKIFFSKDKIIKIFRKISKCIQITSAVLKM